jgi:hypothetical protein
MDIVAKLGLALFLAGVAMLITGSLPRDKMEGIDTLLGGKAKDKDRYLPPLRARLLIGGATLLFVGLIMLGVVHPPALGGGQVEVPRKKTELPPPPYRPSPTPRRPIKPQQ